MTSTSSATVDSRSNLDDVEKKAGSSLMSRMGINDNKAGMEGLDKEKINQIIYEASKGSKFYENERKKEEQLDLKIEKLKTFASQISSQSHYEGQLQADLFLDKLRLERDFSHTIVHVDMDAFYAAVEMRDEPSLRSKPMAVGGMGMLSTSNYLARKFGVRAAMPGFIGLKLCPGLLIVKPNFDKYTAVSHEIRKILAVYDPNFCPMSLDEAYLDFSQHLENRNCSFISERTFILRCTNKSNSNDGTNTQSKDSTAVCLCDLNDVLLPSILNSDVFLSLISDEAEFQSYVDNFNSDSANEDGISTKCLVCNKMFPRYKLKVYGLTIEEAVLEMRNRIEQHTQLTASAGIAPNMMLAKICSDKNKPNGQYRILPNVTEVENFIQDLPIRKVSGIGKVTEKLLGGLEVMKCSDIYSKRSVLYHLFSPSSFDHFLSISLGIGSTTVERDDERKSISTETTFSEISDMNELCTKCEEMCIAVSNDMKEENIKGKTVTLKLKTVSFEVRTRSLTLPDLTNDVSVIINAAKKLLMVEIKNSQPAPLRLRLMGVRMSKLTQANIEQATVNNMFRKYKERGATSTKDQSEICCENGLEEGLSVQEEGEEDFSRPLTETDIPLQCQNNSKSNTKRVSVSVSPSKTKKDAKKNENSSGSILNFFTRQRQIKVEHNKCRLVGQENSKNTPEQSVIDCDKSKEINCKNLIGEHLDMKHNPRMLNNIAACSSSGANTEGSVSNGASFTCPICGLKQSGSDLERMNRHIDACLSQQTIQGILHDDELETQSQSSKVKRPRPDAEERIVDGRHSGKMRKIQSSVLSYFQP